MRLLLTLLVLALASPALATDLVIRFLDVGQGDAVLIQGPDGKTALDDGGRSEARMRQFLARYGVRSLDLLVASHTDADHATGLIVGARLTPKLFLNNGLAGITRTYRTLLATLKQAGTPGLQADERVIRLGSVELTVLPPPPGLPVGNQNLHSVGLLVRSGNFRALLTGDSETAETQGWLRRHPTETLGPIDMYKSIHHGAANGDNAAWLAAVRPRNVVVSVGPNSYGHPTRQALSLYRQVGATTYRTDQLGTVTVRVQAGGRYRIETERGAAQPATPPAGSALARTGGTGAQGADPSCAAARPAGVAPLRRGQPGYGPRLDRDGDGVACE